MARKPEKTDSLYLQQAKLWYLQQIKVFADLPESDKRELLAITHMTSYAKHELIYFPGQPGNMVYLLKKGRVKISRLNEEGQEATLCILQLGEIFGEVEALGGLSRETMVHALEPALVCKIDRDVFERFLEKTPSAGLRMWKQR